MSKSIKEVQDLDMMGSECQGQEFIFNAKNTRKML